VPHRTLNSGTRERRYTIKFFLMNTRISLLVLASLLSVKALLCQTKKADCNNLYLDTVSFNVLPDDTVISGFIHYMDSSFAVYPVLQILLEDTGTIKSPDMMVLSFLKHGSKEHFAFRLRLKNKNFQNNQLVNALFHIYDSDTPGDSIVSCYFPITIRLLNSTSVLQINAVAGTKIFPNPAGNSAILEFDNSSAGSCSLDLYDLKGMPVRTIADITGNRVEIERKELPRGMYFYHLRSDARPLLKGKLVFE
jgi:hypothetical protein